MFAQQPLDTQNLFICQTTFSNKWSKVNPLEISSITFINPSRRVKRALRLVQLETQVCP